MIIKTFIKLLLGRGIGSQFGEDEVLVSLLPAKGTYVDVGAYHPHLYSNTYRLYRKGWSGVAIDPNPDMRILWRLFRHRDPFINCAIGNKGTAVYYMHRDPAYNGFVQQGSNPLVGTKIIEVRPLSHFLKAPIDLLNIDCEGMDYEVLQTHDWAISPSVIAIEAQEHGPAHQLLLSRGYELYAKKGLTLIFRLKLQK